MAKKKVLIVGAGMAGMTCAIRCAQKGHQVTVFERNDKIGKKILVTGNGRCNISNTNITNRNFHSETAVIFDDVFNRFGLRETRAFFADLGIDLCELDEGKLYPVSLQAKSVVNALLMEAGEQKVQMVYNARIREVEFGKKYKIVCDGKSYYGTHLVIATGGRSYSDSGSSGDGYELARSFGHHLVDTYPSIVQLRTNWPYNKSLKGLKVNAAGILRLSEQDGGKVLREESGEVLFTDYGLSGPVVLQLSTMVEPYLSQGRHMTVELDLFPNVPYETLDSMLMKRFHRFSNRTVTDSLNGFINQRLIQPLLKSVAISREQKAGDVTKVERQRFTGLLKCLSQEVTGTYLWNQAQVTKGGVDCREIDGATLESKLQQGLFFIGEVMDMDGDCGGYNLQWAISSGAVAAESICTEEVGAVSEKRLS